MVFGLILEINCEIKEFVVPCLLKVLGNFVQYIFCAQFASVLKGGYFIIDSHVKIMLERYCRLIWRIIEKWLCFVCMCPLTFLMYPPYALIYLSTITHFALVVSTSEKRFCISLFFFITHNSWFVCLVPFPKVTTAYTVKIITTFETNKI